jgi:hypothetical protein
MTVLASLFARISQATIERNDEGKRQGFLPGPAHADDELVLVDAVAVLVALELLGVVPDEPEHLVGGDAALLDVLARGVEAGVGPLGKTGLEWEQVVRHGAGKWGYAMTVPARA